MTDWFGGFGATLEGVCSPHREGKPSFRPELAQAEVTDA